MSYDNNQHPDFIPWNRWLAMHMDSNGNGSDHFLSGLEMTDDYDDDPTHLPDWTVDFSRIGGLSIIEHDEDWNSEYDELAARYREHFQISVSQESAARKPSGNALYAAPAARIEKILKFVFSKRAYALVFEPAVDDYRIDYFEALSANNVWQSRWIIVRGNASICLTAAVHVGVTVVKRIIDIWTLL